MARFESINTKTWRDPTFYDWPTDAKLAWIWFLTNEQATRSGLQEVHRAIMAAELGVLVDRAEAILKLLAESGKVDLDGTLVWVVRRFDYQPNSPKVRESVARDLRLHARSPLVHRFWARYRHLWPAQEREVLERELTAMWSCGASNGQTVEPSDGSPTVSQPSIDGPITTLNQSTLNQDQTTPEGQGMGFEVFSREVRALFASKDMNKAVGSQGALRRDNSEAR